MNKTYIKKSENGGFSETNAKEGLRKTIGELVSKRKKWEKHQKIADDMLYYLLEETLSFYRFLKRDDKYEEAFKDICPVRYGKRTTLAQILVESIFGKGKKTYAYKKAIVKAFDELDENEGMGMYQWLVNNGGVNGVIRSVRGVDKKAEDEAKSEAAGKAVKRYKKYFYKRVTVKLDRDEGIQDGTYPTFSTVKNGIATTSFVPGLKFKEDTQTAILVEMADWMIKQSTAAQRAEWDKEAEKEEAMAQEEVAKEAEKMEKRIAERAEAMAANAELVPA
jgi:hypothetical protein